MIIDTGLEMEEHRLRQMEKRDVKYIIIHHTGVNQDQTVEEIHDYHMNVRGWAAIGYHYYIRMNGDIYKGRPDDKKGVHAGEPANSESLAICLAGNFIDNKPTDEQMNSLVVELILNLHRKYGQLPITGHEDHANTLCPGDKFLWGELEKRLEIANNKVKIDFLGTQIEGIKKDGQIYIHIRELEKIKFTVHWQKEETTVKCKSKE